MESLQLGDLGCATGNYGALRGRNEWSNCQTGFVIGRPLPQAYRLENEARAYAAALGRDIAALGEYERSFDPFTDATGKTLYSYFDTHNDPTVRAVMESKVAAELEQAIDRLRLIHNPTKKTVYLLGYPTVQDVEFDEVKSWTDISADETRHEKALRMHGWLPLGAKHRFQYMRELFPDLSGSYNDPLKVRVPYIRFIDSIQNPNFKDSLREVVYSIEPKPGGRARRVKALAVAETEMDARSKIEKLTGLLRECTFTDATAISEPAQNAVRLEMDREAEVAQNAFHQENEDALAKVAVAFPDANEKELLEVSGFVNTMINVLPDLSLESALIVAGRVQSRAKHKITVPAHLIAGIDEYVEQKRAEL